MQKEDAGAGRHPPLELAKRQNDAVLHQIKSSRARLQSPLPAPVKRH